MCLEGGSGRREGSRHEEGEERMSFGTPIGEGGERSWRGGGMRYPDLPSPHRALLITPSLTRWLPTTCT